MDKRDAVMIVVIGTVTSVIYFAFVLSVFHSINEPAEKRGYLTGVNCSVSEHIARKVFLHVRLKENKKVYDKRYFWENEDEILKADIIGVQMNQAELKKICTYCPA